MEFCIWQVYVSSWLGQKTHILKTKGKDLVVENPIKFKGKGMGKAKKDPNIDQLKGKGKAQKEPNIDQGKVKDKVMKEPNIAKDKGKGKCKAKAMDHKCNLRRRERSKVYQQTVKQMLKAGITADRAKQAAREAACARVQSMFGPSGKGAT